MLLCEASRAPSCSNVNSNVGDIAKGECERACGWVRNVALIKCIFGSGKHQGVGISGGRVYEPAEGMGKLVYEQPGNEMDGSCHSKEGSK